MLLFGLLGFLWITGEAAVPVRQEAGYVEVRPGAHMFWLLQYSTHPDGYLNRPWLIWIQGGPGRPGTGYGNFAMFGPEDMDGNPRNTTWLQSASLVYVDSPVGTGYSYLEEGANFSIQIEDISADLLAFISDFLQQKTEFQEMPLFLFGQSYGGKMVTAFGYYLEQRRQAGDIECDLKAIAIGNGFVSPLDFIENWPDLPYQMSELDDTSRDVMLEKAAEIRAAYNRGDYQAIPDLYWATFMVLHTNEVDVYDVIKSTPSMYSFEAQDVLEAKMEKDVKPLCDGIPPDYTFKGRQNDMFLSFWGEDAAFSHPVYHMVDSLLVNSSVQVVVYSGQYDVICSTSGALAWVRRLTWPGMEEYHNEERLSISDAITDETLMYVKAHEQFKFYWVLKAGHVVPRDAPDAALKMINRIFDNIDV